MVPHKLWTGIRDVRTELESKDIERIAAMVIEKLLPLIQSQQPDRILTIDELSMMIGKSKAQIYQWVNQSQHGLSDFPYGKVGKSLRFFHSEILAWMKSRGKSVRNPLEG
jgi:predicted DNA-binding transcriptional regulator AlpA